MDYDVIIVGARCAGASLGARLAAAGMRVVMLDADRMPSDMPMSTHLVHAPGMDMLDELGVGDNVRAITPPTRSLRVELDGVGFTARLGERASYCIRRDKLDAWLQNAAVAAGAELRDQTKVVDLLREGERVCGVVVQTKTGRSELRAKLVIGADGPHSTVAKLTAAPEYLGFDSTRAGYFFYWPKPAVWDTDAYPYDALLSHRGDDLLYVFQCNDDQLLITVVLERSAGRAWGAAYRERYIEWLQRSPIAAPLVANNQPVSRGMGLMKAHFFYRHPVGPGYALVGDAGQFKDFVTGHGISDALLSARDLSHAVLDGRSEAFEWYVRHRDATSLPLYFDAREQGAVGYNHALNRLVFRHLGQSPELQARLGEVVDRRRSPGELIESRRVFGWVAKAVLRGQFGVIAPFLATGRRIRDEHAELARRIALYQTARTQFEPTRGPVTALSQSDAAE